MVDIQVCGMSVHAFHSWMASSLGPAAGMHVNRALATGRFLKSIEEQIFQAMTDQSTD
jgi:quinol-cytochrome oxidoreductase complex cytochrome b subunit